MNDERITYDGNESYDNATARLRSQICSHSTMPGGDHASVFGPAVIENRRRRGAQESPPRRPDAGGVGRTRGLSAA